MSVVFELYSRYYDLIYRDKNNQTEVEYVNNLIQHYKPGAQSILDLGCGTGRPTYLLSQMGYKVHGVDFSKEMLVRAKEKEDENRLIYTEGDIKNIRLGKRFDVVESLFHVMSYQVTNKDLFDTFYTAYEHLDVNGLFIFDCWYGPAVLTQRPEVRIKKIFDQEIEVIRIAEPILCPNENIVLVNYKIYIREVSTDKIEEINETHKMRYLFKPEIEMILSNIGFKIHKFNVFLSDVEPSQNSWSVIFVAIKEKAEI